MKNLNLAKPLSLLIIATSLFSCSADDPAPTPIPQPPINNQGTLNIFAIDTAAVYKMNDDGTNSTLVLDKKVDLNSYLYRMSIKPDGSKVVLLKASRAALCQM